MTFDLDLFAGPGGWDVAAHRLGLAPLGVEWNDDAVATARAAGFARIHDDVAALDPLAVARDRPVGGLIASPPCQAFSQAGRGRGRVGAQVLLEGVVRIGLGEEAVTVSKEVDAELDDERAALVLEPLRWALDLEPTWLAFEQVPPVLPLWQAMARVLRRAGWHVDTGILSAEEFDVPQTRRRAILVANRDVDVRLPPPVRRRYVRGVAQHEGDARLLPWLSIADALGDDAPSDSVQRSNYSDHSSIPGSTAAERGRTIRRLDEPSVAITGKGFQWQFAAAGATSRATAGALPRELDEPAATVTGVGSAAWVQEGKHVARVSVREAALLQGFPADHPWQGSTKGAQYQQVGDAVPPPLAEHVLRAAMGHVASDGLW